MIKMKRKDLLNELLFVGAAFSKNEAIPILKNVRFEAKHNEIGLTVTDLDLTATASIKTSAPETSFCVPYLDLKNALANSTADEIELVKEQAKVLIVCGKTKFRLPMTEVKDFPETPTFKNDGIAIDGGTFAEALTLTHPACTDDISRFTLNAIFFKNNGNLNVWALDGNICSYLTSKKPIHSEEFEFQLPSKAARGFIHLCKAHKTVTLFHDPNHVGLKSENRMLIARKMSGRSPDIQQIRAANENHTLVFQNDSILQAIRASQSLDDLVENKIGFAGRFSRIEVERVNEKEIRLKSIGGDSAFETEVEIIKAGEFEPFKINSFDLQRLLLAHSPEKEIKFVLNGADLRGFIETDNFHCELMQQSLNI